jgi:menaquinol-cytochrome c reductase iron-sulfur subunit
MAKYAGGQEISRRRFFIYVIAGISSAIGAAVATPLIGYFLSPAWKKEKGFTVPIVRASTIPIGVPTFVRFEERVPDAWVITTESKGAWVVTKDGQNFVVFDPHCTHLNCPYYWDAAKQIFQCPCHNGQFDINGKVLAGPPPRPLDRLEFVIKSGEIEITGQKISGVS